MKPVLTFWSCVLAIKLVLSSMAYYQTNLELTHAESIDVMPDTTQQVTYPERVQAKRVDQAARLPK